MAQSVARTVAEGARALVVVYAVVQVGAAGAPRGPFLCENTSLCHLGALREVVRPYRQAGSSPDRASSVGPQHANLEGGEQIRWYLSYWDRSFFLSDSQTQF